MGYKSKYKGSEIDSLLDKSKNDYNVKQYADYAGYNADTSRPSNTISLIQQDQSVVVGGKRYSQNAECYVGSNTSGISTTGNWFLCGEATITNARDVNIMGIVQHAITSGACGIFALGLRGYSESASKFNFSWLCKTGGTVPLLRVVINGHTVKLYCKVYGGQYQYAHIRLLDQCNQYESENYKTSFFTLKDSTTIIPEADVPSGTDIADVPYLTKSGGTATGTMTFKEWVYNDKSVRNKQGEYAHIAYNSRGTAGYVKIATITINQTHADEPIYFDIIQRQQPLAKLRLQYSTTGNTNPPLNTFTYQGTSVNYYYLHQTGSSTWDLYVRKFDSWTAITVSKVYIGGYSNGFYQNPFFTITWQDELVTAVPEGSVAATKATEYVNISGNATTATKATQDGNGIVIAGNYQRVYKSSFHVTADGWYKLAFRPRTSGGVLDWKDKYMLVDVFSRQGGPCSASFKILYSSHGGWLARENNEFMCIPLTATNYACVSNVRLLSKAGNVPGNSYIELYIQLSKGGNNASTDVEISIESNISNTYLYNTATAGETDTSAYDVITRNARTAVYGGSSAVGGLVAEKALKLATARKIGFANFDGTADVSLNNIQGVFNVRWTTNTTQWQRVMRFKSNKTYMKSVALIAVNDIESQMFAGILKVHLGTISSTSKLICDIKWLTLSNRTAIDYSNSLKAYATYPTDTDEYVYIDIYANSPRDYTNMLFNVLTTYNNEFMTYAASGEWVEASAIPGTLLSTSSLNIVPNNAKYIQANEGVARNKDGTRQVEYICGLVVLSDIEEEGKAFRGSSANPLVTSVPKLDPYNATAGDKINVNIARFYYSPNYWSEIYFPTNDTISYIYIRNILNSKPQPWRKMLVEDNSVEYNAWVQKATAADSAAVANKTKYPIVFKRNGASITNWFANTTFAIDIPEELLDYSSPTGITLKVPEISVANEAKKVSNDLEIRVNGKQKATFDGSSAKTVNIEASRSHFVKASMYGEKWTSPPAGATTPGIPLILDTSYMIPFGRLQDGDTIIMQVPNTLTSTLGYPVYLRLDTTQGNVAGNLVKIIKGQNAGNPVEWEGTTALTAGYYHFVYSEGAGGLIFMYRNVSTS